ncbi:MAG: sugar ABC transporter substrate-binding protein [Mesorhizobium sp.]|uniref:sugar ABC transporter substrate-binding protein n=1 Tax=Mesorhizobium sp. TaxID=1871066 RepID=UPI000FE9CA14|nr:substrate-binding domain-containing protein [Mesorhizobium sp.]RWL17933.1 MAG: sugar ABC transporter substrate-binding protein [Mesorhizobium sp.]
MSTALFVAAISAALITAAAGPASAQDLSGKRIGYSVASSIDVVNHFIEVSKRQAALPGNGEQLTVVNANHDPLKQVTDVESLLSQGVDGIIIITDSDVGWESILQRAKAQGIPVINHSGFALTGATQNVMLPFYDGGYFVGKAAADWLNANFGGEGEVGVLGQFGDGNARALRTKGMMDGVTKNSKATVVAQVEAANTTDGATGAANILSAHPDVRVLLAFNDDVGVGALQAAKEAGKADPSKFFLGGSDGLPPALDAINSGSIYQASFDLLFGFSAVQTMRDMEAMLRGHSVKPARMHTGMAITRANLEEVRRLNQDPLADEARPLYPRVTYYSDQQLKKGDSAPPRQ